MDELKLAKAQAMVVKDLLDTVSDLLYDPEVFEDEEEQKRLIKTTKTLETAKYLLRQIYERSE